MSWTRCSENNSSMENAMCASFQNPNMLITCSNKRKESSTKNEEPEVETRRNKYAKLETKDFSEHCIKVWFDDKTRYFRGKATRVDEVTKSHLIEWEGEPKSVSWEELDLIDMTNQTSNTNRWSIVGDFRCASCNKEGHLRSSNHKCEFNLRNW